MTLSSETEAKAWLRQLPVWTDEAGDRLDTLVDLLARENAVQNLVSAGSLGSVWLRHIADSAQLLTHVELGTPGVWLDLGTGAGFPGMVIAAMLPDRPVHLVESRKRRIEWLNRARSALGLDNVVIHGARLEQIGEFPAAFISARAFAPLDRLLLLSARFSTAQTAWLLPKGRSASQELNALRGWDHLFHVEQSLTDEQAGVIVGSIRTGQSLKRGRKP